MYRFPEIATLSDVLPAIVGRDEFIVAERPFGYVVNYLVNLGDETFPEINWDKHGNFLTKEDELYAIRRECRGLVFDTNKNIMSRRFHKFFNVGERIESRAESLDLNQDHVLLDKLDGSMITPIIMPDNEIRWGTKMGLTDVALPVEEFVKRNQNYHNFAREMTNAGLTPIFEWCSRKQRIVIDYPNDMLTLLAIRANVSGKYYSYERMQKVAANYWVPVVQTFGYSNLLRGENAESITNEIRGIDDQEGIVIRFYNGHMYKVKSDWYCQIHRCKESLAHEKNLVDLIVNEQIDDLKPHLLSDDLVRVNAYEKNFWHGVQETILRLRNIHNEVGNKSKKEFALSSQDMNSLDRSVIFGAMDGKDITKSVIDRIKGCTSSGTKVDSMRHLWGNHKWEYTNVEVD